MAEIVQSIQQGGDYLIELPIINTAGLPVDLSTATQIKAALLVNNVIVAKYSLAVLSGYGVISLKAGAGNEHIMEVQVRRSESKNFPKGIAKFVVLLETPEPTLGDQVLEYTFDGGSAKTFNVVEGALRDEAL